MNTAIVPGSLSAVAKAKGQSIAESFLSADVIAIVDVSGSMSADDSRGGQQRYRLACDELARLQGNHPGRIAVVAFSDMATFEPGGVPVFQGSGTDLARALEFARVADGTVQMVVISDGCPNSEEGALRVARSLTSRIDTVFVGPEQDTRAQDFLRRLAKAHGGQSLLAEHAADLCKTVETLLLKAGN